MELWLRHGLLTARDISAMEIVTADPRRMLARVSMQGLWMVFLVAHALDSSYGEAAQRQWWLDTAACLRRARAAGLPLVVLADASARLGSVLSPRGRRRRR